MGLTDGKILDFVQWHSASVKGEETGKCGWVRLFWR